MNLTEKRPRIPLKKDEKIPFSSEIQELKTRSKGTLKSKGGVPTLQELNERLKKKKK